jgi:Protein of unknown function (DUF418)
MDPFSPCGSFGPGGWCPAGRLTGFAGGIGLAAAVGLASVRIGNLRDRASLAGSYGISAVVFAVSALLAEWMRRTGQRGPMEVLLRRMSYPRVTTPADSHGTRAQIRKPLAQQESSLLLSR